MPLELAAQEQVLFPSPFVATEQNALVVTTQRVVQYAPHGSFSRSKTRAYLNGRTREYNKLCSYFMSSTYPRQSVKARHTL